MAIYTTNNKIWKLDNKWVTTPYVDPYNPLGLPPNTIRCKFASRYTPSMGDHRTLVDSTNNVWDIYKESNDWNRLFNGNNYLEAVLGANTTNVTAMNSTFQYCHGLLTVSLFDTSNVTNMGRMFEDCNHLTIIPLFNTSKVIVMDSAFSNCYRVESGALALYQQASSQTTPPTYHSGTFSYCGQYTQTGSAELAQIPYSWGGTGA